MAQGGALELYAGDPPADVGSPAGQLALATGTVNRATAVDGRLALEIGSDLVARGGDRAAWYRLVSPDGLVLVDGLLFAGDLMMDDPLIGPGARVDFGTILYVLREAVS